MNCMRIVGASLAPLLIAIIFFAPAEARNARYHRYHLDRQAYAYRASYPELTQERVQRTAQERVRESYSRTRPASVRRARVANSRNAEDCNFTNDGRSVCRGAVTASAPVPIDADGNRAYAMVERTGISGRRVYAMVDEGTVIGSRPSDCPHAYCGCGLRKYLGLSDVRLNLASNWARYFPRVPGPGPGLAAVRNHHVMYIEAAAGNGQWVVRDYNSGGGKSRVHVRDVRGYTFVDPRSRPAG